MSDFFSLICQFNTGSDSVPIWTAGSLSPGGVGGANETRFCNAGQGSAVTAALWPNIPQPVSVQAVPEAWAINTDNGSVATGYKIATYGAPTAGIVPYSLMARWGWTQDGTFASAPKITAYTNSSHVNPVAGQQPPAINNDTFLNGSAGDTGSFSYLKANAYGYGVDGSGVQQTPAAGSLTTPVAATDGTNGVVTTASGAWLATHWQSLQGGVTSIQNGVTPAWTNHSGTPTVQFWWYWAFMLFIGPANTVGPGITFAVGTLSYSFT